MDSPWNDDLVDDSHRREVEWDNISSNFTNAGYREGITTGKEEALQEGFDSGFEVTGAPLGRQVGRARGMAAALLALLSDGSNPFDEELVAEAREIASHLGTIRFSDIVPPDLEAEEHARQHRLAEGEEMDVNEDIQAKRDVEGLEDLVFRMGTSEVTGKRRKEARPTMEDFNSLVLRMNNITEHLELEVHST
ncbi:hypothetical protein FA15DRAFT_664511 [Coprinopsis marcescibilis]|uniref:Protein YAE1 n=1 Tax=Coprinopsis marcescibilis TaxID=230819 RepID=A0A5C3L8V2_COPMA|nr:hypothetical protein FA15DRAFT_664511 [Coprinopsis marcescibilis]